MGKRNDLRWRLNVAVDDRMSFSSVGRRYHARGVATWQGLGLDLGLSLEPLVLLHHWLLVVPLRPGYTKRGLFVS